MSGGPRVVVVGAGLAGLRTCESLRRNGFDGPLTLVGAERHLPYSRPPLSKDVLRGESPADAVSLRPRREYADLALDLRLGTAAVELRPAECSVRLSDGTALPYDRLVVATGAAPRTLPGSAAPCGVHTLRTLDDAVTIRDALRCTRRLVVIGAGFIGAEVAASARALGCDVTLVEALPVPFVAALGEEIGALVAGLHTERGVDVRCGVGVAGFEGDRRLEAVRLTDGAVLPADLAVVGIGVRPSTDWLVSSGIALADGVDCDAWCRASAPGVYAVGDVARWHNPVFGEAMRVEHWTTAGEQAAYVGRTMFASDPEPFETVPYFWSDQYDVKLTFLGRPGGGEEVRVVHHSPDGGRLLALYRHGDRLGGVLGLATTRLVMKLRPLLAAAAPWDEAVARASELAT